MSNIVCDECGGDYKVCEHGLMERVENLEEVIRSIELVPEHHHMPDGTIIRWTAREIQGAEDRAKALYERLTARDVEG